METLVKYDCIEEERLERILRFDHRLLKSQISNLLRERMVHKRIKPPELGMKRKSKIGVYYFVNYKSLVDIVHFKLYRMRWT
ncbi:unnamed protein product [Allacma fusca]|uniref:TFIIEalpha/SarR/Rpc3 HTH domain-containing protein n=1 Tax=Allacma fusca TaxID=39272 RepID=A0A8J2KUS5_9HEXA|nr:unnamed protein product [Allacma fusca]